MKRLAGAKEFRPYSAGGSWGGESIGGKYASGMRIHHTEQQVPSSWVASRRVLLSLPVLSAVYAAPVEACTPPRYLPHQ